MIKTPINDGLLQSDLDCAGFDLLNFSGGGGGTAHGIPAGGTTGQSLTKIDATDYNAHWITVTGGGGGLPEGWVSVKAYGAAGNGVTDDTAAVVAAIAAATAVVYFPPGQYFFAGSIGAVPDQISLVGATQFGPNYLFGTPAGAPLLTGSILLLTANAGTPTGTPFITLGSNSSVTGLVFYWPNQLRTNTTAIGYPWAIHIVDSCSASVRYCGFIGAYQAIYAEHSVEILIEEIRGEILYRGIKLEGNNSVTRLKGCYFDDIWSRGSALAAFRSGNAITIMCGRNDLLIINDCFSYNYQNWLYFYDDPAHGSGGVLTSSWCQVNGGGGDLCGYGILVQQSQPLGLDISGVHLTGCFPPVFILGSHTGSTRIHDSMMYAQNGVFGLVDGSGEVTVENCYFFKDPTVAGTTPETVAAIGWTAAGSGNFALRNCTFRTSQTHVSLGASLVRAVVTGNLCSDTFNVTNNMAAGSAVIDGNTGGGTVYVGADARLVSISGGVKLEVRNTGTGTWLEATRYTNP